MRCIDHLQREQEDLESKDTKEKGSRNLRIRDDTEKVCKKGNVGGLSNNLSFLFLAQNIYILFAISWMTHKNGPALISFS